MLALGARETDSRKYCLVEFLKLLACGLSLTIAGLSNGSTVTAVHFNALLGNYYTLAAIKLIVDVTDLALATRQGTTRSGR